MKMGDIDNRKGKLDSKLRKINSEMETSMSVNCRENFSEYLSASTLHGLRYVGDRKISLCERLVYFTNKN